MTAFYETVFGVEPYNPSNGGAFLTQENLLVSLWEIVGGDPFDPSAYLRVEPYTPANIPSIIFFGPGVEKNIFNSRQSCRMAIQMDDDAPFTKTFLALLNPPAELKQAVIDPQHPAFMDGPTYPDDLRMDFTQNLFFGVFMGLTVRFFSAMAGYAGQPLDLANLPLSLVGTPAMIPLPVFRTSGADGVAPTPYGPFPAAQDHVNAINELKNGAPFFLPVLFTYSAVDETDIGLILDIAWQFSGAGRS